MGVVTESESLISEASVKPKILEFLSRLKSHTVVLSTLGTTRTHNNSHPQYLSSRVELHAETRLNSAILTVSASKSGILAGCDDGSIFLLTADLTLVRSFPNAHRGACSFLEWHSDGIHFVSSGSDRTVRVWTINGSTTAPLLLSIPHSCEVMAVCFDPRCAAISDSQPSSIWIFTCGLDNRLRFWRGGLLEQYESLGCVPVSLVSKLEIDQIAIYVGTSDGRVLMYGFSHGSFSFLSEAVCRNRQGKFSRGVAVIGMALDGPGILVSTADHRLRWISAQETERFAEFEACGKYKGLVNGGGVGSSSEGGFRGFKGFLVTGVDKKQFVICGSECGNVFVWAKDSSEKEKTSETWENFVASEKPDKLTALSAAPWNPEASDILPLCLVAGTSEGAVRVFYNRRRKV